jgi:hypothetical protein
VLACLPAGRYESGFVHINNLENKVQVIALPKIKIMVMAQLIIMIIVVRRLIATIPGGEKWLRGLVASMAARNRGDMLSFCSMDTDCTG